MISGELFYEMVTGEATALNDLYHAIPAVLQKIITENGSLSREKLEAMAQLQQQVTSQSEQDYRQYFFDYAFRNFNPDDLE